MTKILVIFTGGTIASVVNNNIIDTDINKPYELIDSYLKIDKNVSFDTVEPYFILSENLSGEHITKLVLCVKNALEQNYDGVIITHGTDTLQYSASALDIMLEHVNKPVMLVSSNYPLADLRANGFDNFCGAVSFIKQGRANGVFVSYKNKDENLKFHTAENLLEYDSYSDSIRSIDNNIFSQIKTDDTYCANERFYAYRKQLKLNNYSLPLKSSVLRLKSCPGMKFPSLKGLKCVIFDTYHSGTLKTDDGEFFDFVKEAEKANVTVVLTGVSGGNVYKSAKDFDEYNNIVLSTYSPIYTYMKCWILTENNFDIKENF